MTCSREADRIMVAYTVLTYDVLHGKIDISNGGGTVHCKVPTKSSCLLSSLLSPIRGPQ